MSLKTLAARKAISHNTVLMVVLSILLPPLAVWAKKDLKTEFIIALVLTLVFWVPGILYALWMTFKG